MRTLARPHPCCPPICLPRLAFLLIACCLWLAARPAGAQPEGLEGRNVTEIQFEGLQGTPPERLRARLQTREGAPLRAVELQEDLRRLGALMRTASVDVEPRGEGAAVIYRVEEFPRLRELQVIGNSELKTERIESILGVKQGDVLDDDMQRRLRRSIANEYQTRGMPQTKVTLNVIDVAAADAPSSPATPLADLQVVVDEGRQVLADDLILRGNDAFSDIRLRAQIETTGSAGFFKNYFSEETFEEDLRILRDFYAAHGYFDARVERGLFEERTDDGKPVVSPVIEIEEGARYTFGPIEVRGVRLFSQPEAEAPFEGLEGDPFDGKRLSQSANRLRDLYFSHGLLTTEFDPRYEPDQQAKRMDITVDVNEGERIHVGRIRVVRPALPADTDDPSWFRGWYQRVAPPVKDEVILREILLEPGAIYNKRLEADSARRLSRLGVFEQDTLRAFNAPTGEPGVHDMVTELQESTTGLLSGGIGYGDASGPFIFGQFSERNVGGNADVLTARLTLGTRDSGFVASYLDRHLGNSLDSMFYQAFAQTLRRPGYDARTGGVNAEWGRALEGDWRNYVRGRLEYVAMDERKGVDAKEDLNESYPVAAVRLRIEEDARGPVAQRFTEGWLQSYSTELGYAGGPLARFETEQERFMPISERLTWRVAANAGFLPYSRDVLPVHERYFLGGNNDMRGFKYRGAGYFDEDDNDVPIGGAAKALVRNELLFPIIDPIGGVLFADVGALGETPLSWQAPRASAGVGVRFDLRNVQVGIDLAAPVMKQGDDQTRFFHFSLRSQFQ